MLTNKTLAGRIIRLPLRAIPKSAEIRILSGPNRGMKWVVGSSNHGCWLGTYEREAMQLVTEYIRPGMTAFDVGANVGYYTLLLSDLVGPLGAVWAFEPEPDNLVKLAKHIKINRLGNIAVYHGAVAATGGTAKFDGTKATGHLSAVGQIVNTTRLDDFPAPDFIKMDIEGGEIEALKGADQILQKHKTTWLVSLHGPAVFTAPALFERYGYSICRVNAEQILATP